MYYLTTTFAKLISTVLGCFFSKSRYRVFIALFFVFFASHSYARTVAIFPVEDLSRGINSPNLEITRQLTEELVARGLHVVDERDIISFMAAKRLRWLGYLDTDHILEVRESLGADLVLLGTICQRRERKSPAFGLSLTLIRTQDGKTVWSSNSAFSLADMQRLLGLNEPATLEELWPSLVNNVFAQWPNDLSEILGQTLIFDIESGELPPTLQIADVRLSPRYVRPGEQIKCAVQLEGLQEVNGGPQIFIKVGSRVHLAQQSQEGLFYEAAWTGSEIEKGIFREVGHEALKLAATDLDPQFFEGVWPGPFEDDLYPVSLILRWPSGDQQVAFIGTYTVDSSAPDINMHVKGQKFLNGMPVFRDTIMIKPFIGKREPLSRWQISVEDKDGKILMGDEGYGNLPEKLIWRGRKYSGFLAEEGVYRLILKVWDRAGNEQETAKEVAYMPSPPDMIVEVEKIESILRLGLIMEEDTVPLAFWRLEAWAENGDMLKAVDGQELPATVDIPLVNSSGETKIEGIIIMRDVLGNQSRLDINDLYLMAMQKEDQEKQETTETEPENKEDSWA
jgi:hypothetical protein